MSLIPPERSVLSRYGNGLLADILLIAVVGIVGAGIAWALAWTEAAYVLVRHALGYGPALKKGEIEERAFVVVMIGGIGVLFVIAGLIDLGVLRPSLVDLETMGLLILGGSVAVAVRRFWRWLIRTRS
jgi:hypothetical protein